MQKNTKFGMAKNRARPHFFPRAAGPKGGGSFAAFIENMENQRISMREVDSKFDFFSSSSCDKSVVQDSIYSF